MRELKKYPFLWLAVCLGITADLFLCTKGFSEKHNLPFNAYYTAWALIYFLFSIQIYRFAIGKVQIDKTDYTPILLLLLAFNKLADELFFEPTKLQFNELILLICAIVYGIRKLRKVLLR